MALLARVAARGVRRRVRRTDGWPSPTSIHYYHFDGLGSVIALTNSSGSVVNLYEYSVYGEVSASDPNHPNRFLFTGREFDKDTGLYYYRARYYNPYIGRFLQTDPAGDGVNPYAYCGNDPVGRIDPLGREWYDDPYWDEGTPWTQTVKSTRQFYDLLAWFGGIHVPFDFILSKILHMDPDDDWGEGKVVELEAVYSWGCRLVKVNGIHLLDDDQLNYILWTGDRELDKLVSFHEVNQWPPVLELDLMDKLLSVRTPFQVILGLKTGKFLYFAGDSWLGTPKGDIYSGSEINYIGAGHASAHVGLFEEQMLMGITAYNWINHHNIWGLSGKIYWAKKGYREYCDRKDW